MQSSRNPGLALFEVMALLAISVILALITCGQFAPILDRAALWVDSHRIASLVQRTQLQSLYQERPITLHPAERSIAVTMEAVEPEIIKLQQQNRFCSATPVTMWGRGTSSIKSICIANPVGTCFIRISLRGRARLECRDE